MSRLAFLVSRLRRRIWLIPGIFTLTAVLAAPLTGILGHFIELPPEIRVGEESLNRVMQVLAASMLPVATFSVAAMISAFNAMSANATPRATDLAFADAINQVALGTFVGTFLFSVLSLIGLDLGFYGPTGRIFLFLLVLGNILFIAATLVRWIDHVSKLGLMSTTIDLLERATAAAFESCAHVPRRQTGSVAHTMGRPVSGGRTGYIQRIATGDLGRIARRIGGTIHVLHTPGSRIVAGDCLATVEGRGDLADEDRDAIVAAFVIGNDRTFDYDPLFGLTVLSEIAERALSPAVNDPGSARTVIDAAERRIAAWLTRNGDAPVEDKSAEDKSAGDKSAGDKGDVTLPDLAPESMLDAAFSATARDGADRLEIALRLQAAYRHLASLGDADAARACARQAAIAADRAMAALTLEHDRARLAAVRLRR